jgi:hypothetical protein
MAASSRLAVRTPRCSPRRRWALGGGHYRSLLRGQVGGNGVLEFRGVHHELDRILVPDQGRAEDTDLRLPHDLFHGFALIRGEGRHVDQADHVRGVGSGVGDDRAAVRVPGQQHRTVDLADHARGVGGIGGQASQQICWCDDGVPLRVRIR